MGNVLIAELKLTLAVESGLNRFNREVCIVKRVFGPVPSRRLGRSLGINNIPAKTCSYACVYCQLGRDTKMTIDRKVFYSPEEIIKELQQKISDVRKVGETIDYLTFVPDGEPTLDLNLGKEILLIEPAFNIDVAVITNSSLMWREDVREELMEADLVSFKIDAVNEDIWKKINRPHGRLKLSEILDGILEFSRHYQGKLITETMLIEGLNDSKNCLEDIADFIEKINAETAYVSIPTRPPAEAWVRPATEESIHLGYQLFSKKIKNVEYLIGYEGNAFSFTGDVENDILSITSVHPMRKDAVEEFLNKANSNWSIIKDLMSQKKIVELQYEGKKFYMRNLRRER